MSKKSRKRNRKILAALAGGLGALALAKRKRIRATDAASDAKAAAVQAMTSDAAYKLPSKAANIATDVVSPSSNFQSRFKTKIGNNWVGPGEASGISNRVTDVMPPYVPTPNRVHVGRGVFKHGGRAKVTGIAKRGFGRALMKGKK